MPHRVRLPVGESSFPKERLPDELEEGPIARDETGRVGKDEMALLGRPVVERRFEVHRFAVSSQRRQ